jgi:hypothetical protein
MKAKSALLVILVVITCMIEISSAVAGKNDDSEATVELTKYLGSAVSISAISAVGIASFIVNSTPIFYALVDFCQFISMFSMLGINLPFSFRKFSLQFGFLSGFQNIVDLNEYDGGVYQGGIGDYAKLNGKTPSGMLIELLVMQVIFICVLMIISACVITIEFVFFHFRKALFSESKNIQKTNVAKCLLIGGTLRLIVWSFFGLSVISFYHIFAESLLWIRVISIMIICAHIFVILFGVFKLYNLSEEDLQCLQTKIMLGPFLDDLQYSMRMFSPLTLLNKFMNAFAISFFMSSPRNQFICILLSEFIYMFFLLTKPYCDVIRSKLMIAISLVRISTFSLTGFFLLDWIIIDNPTYQEWIAYTIIAFQMIVLLLLISASLRALIYHIMKISQTRSAKKKLSIASEAPSSHHHKNNNKQKHLQFEEDELDREGGNESP